MSKQPKQELIEEVFGKDANLYTDALGVMQNASSNEIEKAYFEKWQKARHRLTPNLPTKERLEINKRLEALLIAYRILSNPILRSKYNEMMVDTEAELHELPARDSPSFSRKAVKSTGSASSEFSYSAKSTKDMLRGSPRNGMRNKLKNSYDGQIDTSFGSADGTVVQSFEGNLFVDSEKFIFPGYEEDNETDDEDVFAGVEDDVTFDEPRKDKSFESTSTTNLSFSTFPQDFNNISNTILEQSNEYENNDDNSVTHRSVGSSLKKGKFSKEKTGIVDTNPPGPSRGVRFQGLDGDDDTLGDTTLGDTTLGDDDLDSLRDDNVSNSCLNMLCVPRDKQFQVNRMLYELSTEIKDSFDDTISAVDQVFNAFTIQPEEYSGLITKLETEKQTLLFSSEFMELAKQEKQKRLESKKKNKKGSPSKIR